MQPFALVVALLALCPLLVAAGPPGTPNAPQDVLLKSVGTNAGLNDLMTREGVSGWFDVDLDGDPDPVWVSDKDAMA
ncbi:MAG: hypothetical protein VX938_04060, partial [Myxococcota bacterium]|nr:hypothetical protein [Myxococcota bacterium]